MTKNGAASPARDTEKPRPEALYERIKRHIADRVLSGEWPEGSRVPSEYELVEALGASRMTVHRALRELQAQGLLVRLQGVGTFVSAPKPHSALIEIRDIADDIAARGHRHSAKLLKLEAIRADTELAANFDLRPGAKIFQSLIVHYEDEDPVQLERRFVSPAFAPTYLDQDFTRETPTRFLMGIAPATEAEHIVFAVTPDAEAQDLLEIEASEPCLLVIRRTWIASGPATKSHFLYPGSRYSLGSRVRLGADGGHG
jgi:GntR family histidine utilization transcriptional repressor